MIARIRGELLESAFTRCVVEAAGVGYELLIPMSTFEQLPPVGAEVALRVHTQVREDAITLFGFKTAAEKSLFELLITVNMVGGKVALGVLSAMPVPTFCEAVVKGDLKLLGRIPGVGKRTAERMVVELRDKLSPFISCEAAAGKGGLAPVQEQAIADALAAFEQLGFQRDKSEAELRKLAAELPPEECSSENLLRRALLIVNGKK